MTLTMQSGADVWSHIKPRLASRGKRHAAIAFIGRDAAKLLPLEAGDVLVVNASDQALRAGACHPTALAQFGKRGVQVWSNDRLHAKVITTAKGVAVVGSANASTHSLSLEEAVVVSTDPQLRRHIREFVEQLRQRSHPVDAAFVARAKPLYRPPKGRPGDDTPPAPLIDALPKRLFFVRREPWEPRTATERLIDAELSRLAPIRGRSYLEFGWAPENRQLRPRDVLCWCRRGWVEPPAVVLNLSAGTATIHAPKDDDFGVQVSQESLRSIRVSRLPGSLRDAVSDMKVNYVVSDPGLIREVLTRWAIEV